MLLDAAIDRLVRLAGVGEGVQVGPPVAGVGVAVLGVVAAHVLRGEGVFGVLGVGGLGEHHAIGDRLPIRVPQFDLLEGVVPAGADRGGLDAVGYAARRTDRAVGGSTAAATGLPAGCAAGSVAEEAAPPAPPSVSLSDVVPPKPPMPPPPPPPPRARRA